jgi:hypothetical protein
MWQWWHDHVSSARVEDMIRPTTTQATAEAGWKVTNRNTRARWLRVWQQWQRELVMSLSSRARWGT